MQGCIFEVREFCVHDGPGVRTTVFFKGCPLRCRWCQNPEGLSFKPELVINSRPCMGCGACHKYCKSPQKCIACGNCTKYCPAGKRKIAGEFVEAKDLAARVLRDRDFLTSSGGGVTFSGGEPLAQPEFLFELSDRLQGIHLSIETSGFASVAVYQEMLTKMDLVYQDLKCADPKRHRELTGQDNRMILDNLEILKASGKPFVIRIPLIPTCNADEENLTACAKLIQGTKTLRQVELLPYNPAASVKYRFVGREFPLSPEKFPEVDYQNLKDIFTSYGLPCIVM